MARLLICGGLVLPALRHGVAADLPCPTVARRHVDLPAVRAAIAGGEAVRIVAFGSSSTEGAGASAPDRTYPARLEAFLHARWPAARVTVLNRGIGGQTLETMLARIDAGVLAVRPTLVVWQVGANDALRGVDPARFAAMLDEGVRRIVAAGSDLVLMDNQIAPKLPVAEGQESFAGILARQAKARSVSVFSRTDLMREWLEASASAGMIGADGLHHSDRGYACLALSLGDAIAAAAATPVVVVHVDRK